jgi:hypothetical protein
VRSGLTHAVSFAGEEKIGIHAGFQVDWSGQLRFLGLLIRRQWT